MKNLHNAKKIFDSKIKHKINKSKFSDFWKNKKNGRQKEDTNFIFFKSPKKISDDFRIMRYEI